MSRKPVQNLSPRYKWTGISAKEIKNRYRFISEQKAGPVYITNFKLQKVDYNHLGSDIFSLK
ncbi:hypothetical protein ABHE96_001461 [Salmonella enterica]